MVNALAMSFRNPFITDFIYQASEDTIDANPAVTAVFEKYAAVLSSKVDERGYGYYAGWFKTLDGTVGDMELDKIARELELATKTPFRLTIMTESGPILTYSIRP